MNLNPPWSAMCMKSNSLVNHPIKVLDLTHNCICIVFTIDGIDYNYASLAWVEVSESSSFEVKGALIILASMDQNKPISLF
jgi:hypothetical protein